MTKKVKAFLTSMEVGYVVPTLPLSSPASLS